MGRLLPVLEYGWVFGKTVTVAVQDDKRQRASIYGLEVHEVIQNNVGAENGTSSGSIGVVGK